MSRPRKPPRLFLKRRSDGSPSRWFIRDGCSMVSTGYLEDQVAEADALFQEYCASAGRGRGTRLPVAIRPEEGWVYFISCAAPGFPIKIGWASDVTPRLKQMQGALPYKIELLGAFRGTKADEKRLHVGFHKYRLEREWFARNPDLMSIISKCKIQEAA